ncbi:DnaJ domain containing protein [Tritrichomonas foetus]|uniref:DnaJ domain containing protein n=1 Tax=Tritrichomonas foetus TaxID=1144522 RepID=A0A1J4JM96_9EUKA|nr:DnaJ domain containing protein [Tritrichomonas foetus]|eukprot:OHS98653.1 DnaJ domain containing protein [Tritrichomonas foetus]
MLLTLALLFCQGASVDQMKLRNIERLIAFHRFWDAYQQLTSVISQETGKIDNKLYRLRGQCCLNMAMVRETLEDAKKILKNSPNEDDRKFAYVLQSRANMQKGDFVQAKEAAEKTNDRQLIRNCENLRNMELNAKAKMEQGQIGEAAQLLDNLIQNAPKAKQLVYDRANIAWISQDFGRYKELSNELDKEFPSDSTIFYRKGIVSFCDGQMDQANKFVKKSQSMRNAPKNCSDALKAINTINVHYPLAQKAVEEKDAEKAEKEIELTLSAGRQFCPANSVVISTVNNMKVKLIRFKNTPEETLEILTKMLDEDSGNVELMLERGDVNLELEDFDAALFDYQNAQRHRPNDKRAQEGINKANEIKKKKTYVDHYEVLGLKKGASMTEIKNAYKKLVRQWHPDRYGDKQKKKEAEAMMKKINQAYDILGDEQKKRLYDMGQDPDNPGMGGGQDFGGFNVFDLFNMGGGGGNARTFTFGNGGFHFEFHMG